MNVKICKKICKECAFNGNTQNTLYAEAFDIIEHNKIFPCHTYLKSVTGSMNTGTETLSTLKVCRGYVAYVKKHGLINYKQNSPLLNSIWDTLMQEIEEEELKVILNEEELINRHIGLKNKVYLGN